MRKAQAVLHYFDVHSWTIKSLPCGSQSKMVVGRDSSAHLMLSGLVPDFFISHQCAEISHSNNQWEISKIGKTDIYINKLEKPILTTQKLFNEDVIFIGPYWILFNDSSERRIDTVIKELENQHIKYMSQEKNFDRQIATLRCDVDELKKQLEQCKGENRMLQENIARYNTLSKDFSEAQNKLREFGELRAVTLNLIDKTRKLESELSAERDILKTAKEENHKLVIQIENFREIIKANQKIINGDKLNDK